MKLLYILSTIVAITLAEEEKRIEKYEDSQAVATNTHKRGIPKVRSDQTASAYSYPNWQNQNTWQNQQQPANNWQNQNTWQNQQPANNWQNQNTWQNQQQPANNWGNNNNWVSQPQNDQWATNAPVYQTTTTTPPVAVIKNEQYFGNNGDYKYEYQIGDGTHVGEEGYYTDPKQSEESLVKKGWYSFVGADGKTYTVTYWADKTGFHAYGDHLPTPPPVPAAIQAALDKQKEAEKNKPPQTSQSPNYQSQTPVYVTQPTPTYTQKPIYNRPTYNPSYNPSQQYYPSQSTYYPQQQYPQQQYPQQQYQQQTNYA